jgi:hypothetical protein
LKPEIATPKFIFKEFSTLIGKADLHAINQTHRLALLTSSIHIPSTAVSGGLKEVVHYAQSVKKLAVKQDNFPAIKYNLKMNNFIH